MNLTVVEIIMSFNYFNHSNMHLKKKKEKSEVDLF